MYTVQVCFHSSDQHKYSVGDHAVKEWKEPRCVSCFSPSSRQLSTDRVSAAASTGAHGHAPADVQ